MSKIRVVEVKRIKKTSWYRFKYKNETLAGPFKTWEDALQARQEWVVVQMWIKSKRCNDF